MELVIYGVDCTMDTDWIIMEKVDKDKIQHLYY